MLEILPTGVAVFPGSGITGNLADKASPFSITGRAALSAPTARASLRVLDQSVDTAISAGKAFWHACGVCPI